VAITSKLYLSVSRRNSFNSHRIYLNERKKLPINSEDSLWFSIYFGILLRIKYLDGEERLVNFTIKYGIDAPFWAYGQLIIGLVIGVASLFGLPQSFGGLIFGLYLLIVGLWMLSYSTIIKINHRYTILNLANIAPMDSLLDVGTGRGLLAIAAAKLGCKVTGIDKWSQWDLSGNGKAAFYNNAKDEGVESIEILDGDAQQLPFNDQVFDVVVSNYVIHNIKSAEGRNKAIQEMWRVLKPGGRLVISDFQKIYEYSGILKPLAKNIQFHKFY
jgi:arsenite methyltransferase